MMSLLKAVDVDHRALANQLVATVQRFFPALLTLCAGADEPWFWDLLKRLGDIETAQRARRPMIEALLKRHKRRKLTADEVIAVTRSPHLRPPASVSKSERAHAASLMRRLVVVEAEHERLSKLRDALVAMLYPFTEPRRDVISLQRHPRLRALRHVPTTDGCRGAGASGSVAASRATAPAPSKEPWCGPTRAAV